MFIDLQFLDLLKQLKLTLLCPNITVHSVSTILSIFLCTLHISSFHILFLNTTYLHCCCINTYCTIVSTMLTPYSPPITTLQSSQAVGTTPPPPPPGIPSCYSAVSSVWFLSSVSASLAFCSLFSASESDPSYILLCHPRYGNHLSTVAANASFVLPWFCPGVLCVALFLLSQASTVMNFTPPTTNLKLCRHILTPAYHSCHLTVCS